MMGSFGKIILMFLIAFSLAGCHDKRGFVVGKIKKASKLSTTEFNIDKIVFGVKRKKLLWVINLNEAKFIAHSKARIKAGIDLEKLQDKDVTIEGEKISLTLPPVEVINFSYPAEDFKRDSLISGDAFLNEINLQDQEQFFQDAETDIRNNLKYLDIESITQKKTSLMLETMLRTLGYREIYIDYKKGELIPEIIPEE
jgi:hypothetical protein